MAFFNSFSVHCVVELLVYLLLHQGFKKIYSLVRKIGVLAKRRTILSAFMIFYICHIARCQT